jgi:hypothetical protein
MKFHSLLLQGVCDNRILFTDVHTGEPGSMHDARLFQKSHLKEDVDRGLVEFPDNGHLVGNLACGLSTQLIVGFKNNGFLTPQQKYCNLKLSQVRVHIENVFALLKGRRRRLKNMDTIRLDQICLLITAACILHNICILNGDDPNDIMEIEQELAEERNLNAQAYSEEQEAGNRNAINKRYNNSLRLPRNIG